MKEERARLTWRRKDEWHTASEVVVADHSFDERMRQLGWV